MKIERVTCYEVIVPAKKGTINSQTIYRPLHKLPGGAKSGWSMQFDELPKLIIRIELDSRTRSFKTPLRIELPYAFLPEGLGLGVEPDPDAISH